MEVFLWIVVVPALLILNVVIIIKFFNIASNVYVIRRYYLPEADNILEEQVRILVAIGEKEEAKKLVISGIEALVSKLYHDSSCSTADIPKQVNRLLGQTAKLVGIDLDVLMIDMSAPIWQNNQTCVK